MQVLKNLYQVGGDLNGLSWAGIDAGYEDCNTYVVATSQGLLMFDCGCGDTLDQVFANMAYWGLSPDDVEVCLLTHAHLDHAGAAHLLSERGVRLLAHKNAAQAIAAGDERCAGYLYHKTFIPCTVDEELSDGQTVEVLGFKIEVMHLPGHTMGCVAYVLEYEGRKLVVSGDIIGTLLDGHFGWSGSIDFDKAKYIESLRRFATVDSDIMLPGHGLIYFRKPRRRVEEALNEALMQWR
jgi:glyoxylase-like metal-dependent hydrolase (beta-lactamase superfamily II)